MRLALLAPLEHPLTEPYAGGLERHTVQLARGLAKRGVGVTLFARRGSDPLPGVEVMTEFTDYRTLLRYLRTAPFDLVHNNTINFLPTLLSFRLPFPVVTTLHIPPYRRLLPGAMASRFPGGSAFVAISRHLAGRWTPYTGGSLPVIHNGVDPGEWPFTHTAPACTALWYGRITPEKAPHLAVLAARRAGYFLELAGPVVDRGYYTTQLLPLLGKDAVYLGHLSRTELLPHMAVAVGLFTSVWDEPFGLVIPELLACGTPVAGFASGAAPELVMDKVGGLVPVGDVRQLAAALPRTAALDRAACRTYVTEHFTVERMVAAYHTHYLRLLA